jgi:6-phosphogluconate dehydrogenase
MNLGIIGMGKMGSNMARRIAQAGHEVVVSDQDSAQLEKMKKIAKSVSELVAALPSPKRVWTMLPAGAITDEVIEQVAQLLQPGDVIIDGGNSKYQDDVRRSQSLKKLKIEYLDVGVSGGVWGLERGYSLMIGGEKNVAAAMSPIFDALSPEDGNLYCGLAGAGHFAKMVHNGIEYGMMQSLAEGFDILKNNPYNFDLHALSNVWKKGSVIASWLLELISLALEKDPSLKEFEGHVPDSGEGRWTIQAAIELGVPTDVLSAALNVRFRSRNNGLYSQKLLSAMRKEFGGHSEGQQK